MTHISAWSSPQFRRCANCRAVSDRNVSSVVRSGAIWTWLADAEKIVMDVSGHDKFAAKLNGVFTSQIAGGKRYDLATLGRRSANATFFDSHTTDAATQVIFGMDLTPLIVNPTKDIVDYMACFIEEFCDDVKSKLSRRLDVHEHKMNPSAVRSSSFARLLGVDGFCWHLCRGSYRPVKRGWRFCNLKAMALKNNPLHDPTSRSGAGFSSRPGDKRSAAPGSLLSAGPWQYDGRFHSRLQCLAEVHAKNSR